MGELQKIPVLQTNVPVSSKSRFTNRKISSPWPQLVHKIPSARYYSTSIALYESYCLDGKTEPSLQATCLPQGGSKRQRAAPGRAGKIGVALGKRHVGPKFRHFTICEPCQFCAQQPTLWHTLSGSPVGRLLRFRDLKV